jgi:hypothetical protein
MWCGFVFVLVFVLCFHSLSATSCANNCSPPNGMCVGGGICACSTGWAGDDCSYSDIELQNGVRMEGYVGTRRWRYFHMIVSSQKSSLEFQINQTSIGGDIDAYVRVEKFPTRQDYTYRDISTSKSMKFTITSPHGLYYLGVYGFLSSNFSVVAKIHTQCPHDCSQHGLCDLNGECVCDDGYLGFDCSESAMVLQNNIITTNDIHSHEWVYYSYNLQDNNTLFITLNQTSNEYDCDLYVRLGSQPLLTQFDFRDNSNDQLSYLKISNAVYGIYYIGVYGYEVATPTSTNSYSLLLHAYSECPNNCSGHTHGKCLQTTTCECEENYAGESCESMITSYILDGNNVSGYVSGNMWNYYHINTYTIRNINVIVYQNDTNDDCDLYIRRALPPTLFDFDYRDVSSHLSEITIQNPGLATWYVGVYGYTQCTYELSATITHHCPNDCIDESHGVCLKGHCVCHDDWVGDDCGLLSTLLLNGVVNSSSLMSGKWQYYHFETTPNTTITITMKEQNNVKGLLFLYASPVELPSLITSEYYDTQTTTSVHRVYLTETDSSRIRIGVYASSVGTPNVSYAYDLVVWQSRFE